MLYQQTNEEKKCFATFEQACINGNLDKVRELYMCGFHYIKRGFILGCKCGHIKIVKLILKNKDYRCLADTGEGMRLACEFGYAKIVRYLIKYRCKPNNAMLYASQYGRTEIVNYALRKGADNYNSCMVYACIFGHSDIAEIMIHRGARRHNSGFLAACRYGHAHIINLIFNYDNGQSINIRKGMRIACYEGHTDVVLLLINEGLKVSRLCNVEFIKKILSQGATRKAIPKIPQRKLIFEELDRFKCAIVIPQLPSALEDLVRSYFP